MTRRLALTATVAVLGVAAPLLAAQPGLALPRAVTTFLLGQPMIRADVLVRAHGALHVYRVERGVVRSIGLNTIVLRERNATDVKVQIADNAVLTGVPKAQAKRGVLFALRRGMTVVTVRDGELPADRVHVIRPPALPLPPALTATLFGNKMARADVAVQSAGTTHLYRIDRGQIRSIGIDSIVLRERDGSLQTIPIAEDAVLTGVGRGRAKRGVLAALRRNMVVETLREGDEPAERVHVPAR